MKDKIIKPAKTNYHCKKCGATFSAYKNRGERQFCSTQCANSFTKKKERKTEDRLCIGIRCRGEKYFKSTGIENRQCDACRMLAKYFDNTNDEQ